MRPTKIGAKNWLFIGREEAGQSAAVLLRAAIWKAHEPSGLKSAWG